VTRSRFEIIFYQMTIVAQSPTTLHRLGLHASLRLARGQPPENPIPSHSTRTAPPTGCTTHTPRADERVPARSSSRW
jgi:hypothetical protein